MLPSRPTPLAPSALAVVAALASAAAAPAQAILETHHGAAAGAWFGAAIASGDFDGDGVADIAVGAPLERAGSGGQGTQIGAVYVFSSVTGSLLWRAEGGAADAEFGRALASPGDVDGDGRSDLAVGSPGANSVTIHSGATGAVLHTVVGLPLTSFGRALAAVGDVDGDGVGDLVVGAPRAGAGALAVSRLSWVSGASGALVNQALGVQVDDRFGAAVSSIGDLDGDGVHEVVVGAPGDTTNGASAGRVDVLSGATGVTLQSHFGTAAGHELGCAVSGAADLDGDGVRDVVAGAWGDDTFGPAAGAVHAWSGSSGAPLASHFGAAAGDLFGFAVAALSDVDGDGLGDLLVGVPGDDTGGAGAGAALMIASASPVTRLDGGAPSELTGYSVAALPSPMGAPFPFFAVGAPGARIVGNEVGRLTLAAPNGSLGQVYCTNNANSTGAIGRIAAFGSPRVADNDVRVTAYSLPPGAFGFLLASTTQGLVPSINGPTLCLAGQIGRYVDQIGTGPVITVVVDLTQVPQPMGSVAAQVGETWNFQLWHRDLVNGSPNSAMTDALEVQFQ